MKSFAARSTKTKSTPDSQANEKSFHQSIVRHGDANKPTTGNDTGEVDTNTVTKLHCQQFASTRPLSVNYHFHRRCNYKCGFCFHTNTNAFILDSIQAQQGLKKLQECGMRKINFSGGEPFLHPQWLGCMVRYCKEDLNLESVSIVSNGSLIKEEWFQEYATYVDILAISCDSFDNETNVQIGRTSGSSHEPPQREIVEHIAELCREYNVGSRASSLERLQGLEHGQRIAEKQKYMHHHVKPFIAVLSLLSLSISYPTVLLLSFSIPLP